MDRYFSMTRSLAALALASLTMPVNSAGRLVATAEQINPQFD